MSELQRKIDSINEQILEKQQDRESAVDDGDTDMVAEIDADIESLNQQLRRIEIRLEKAEY